MKLDNNQQFFFALLRAGLWSDLDEFLVSGSSTSEAAKPSVKFHGYVDWEKVYQLAEEQSVIGVVLAGIDWFKVHDSRFTIPQEVLLQWIGEVQMIEQQNLAMNKFVTQLIEKLCNNDIFALLVKGQGIAQCYERPLWRASGDIDLLVAANAYQKGKIYLTAKADSVDPEYTAESHLSMMIKDYVVELHGSMHTRLSKRIDSFIDNVQDETFNKEKIRNWKNGTTVVGLPAPDEDVIFVITHIIKHFFLEGIGLRQICDWCRLLWTYQSELDLRLLESRLSGMGLMSEWKAFGAFAVNYLGMPCDAMPFYNSRCKAKGERILAFILETGNFGQNREIDYSGNYLCRKFQSAWRKLNDFGQHAMIFPLDSVKFFFHFMGEGIGNAVRGE